MSQSTIKREYEASLSIAALLRLQFLVEKGERVRGGVFGDVAGHRPRPASRAAGISGQSQTWVAG